MPEIKFDPTFDPNKLTNGDPIYFEGHFDPPELEHDRADFEPRIKQLFTEWWEATYPGVPMPKLTVNWEQEST